MRRFTNHRGLLDYVLSDPIGRAECRPLPLPRFNGVCCWMGAARCIVTLMASSSVCILSVSRCCNWIWRLWRWISTCCCSMRHRCSSSSTRNLFLSTIFPPPRSCDDASWRRGAQQADTKIQCSGAVDLFCFAHLFRPKQRPRKCLSPQGINRRGFNPATPTAVFKCLQYVVSGFSRTWRVRLKGTLRQTLGGPRHRCEKRHGPYLAGIA